MHMHDWNHYRKQLAAASVGLGEAAGGRDQGLAVAVEHVLDDRSLDAVGDPVGAHGL